MALYIDLTFGRRVEGLHGLRYFCAIGREVCHEVSWSIFCPHGGGLSAGLLRLTPAGSTTRAATTTPAAGNTDLAALPRRRTSTGTAPLHPSLPGGVPLGGSP